MQDRIWKIPFNLEVLNQTGQNTMVEACGIVFTDFGDDWLKATMPVNEKTVQPVRILHGGANVVLAETMGSVASILCLEDMNKSNVVGVEINANHLRSVPEGQSVTGTVRPVRIGRKLHVWQIEIHDEQERLVCTSRLTAMVVERK
ncbi:phenylacetic acid degradation protein [Lewinellaceae bacterium SD302]|nr:phenylacetic acid degradation protein [Lewinellaceae bacterium SD302]